MFANVLKNPIIKPALVLPLLYSGGVSATSCLPPTPVDELMSISEDGITDLGDNQVYLNATLASTYNGARFHNLSLARTDGEDLLFRTSVKTTIRNDTVRAVFFSGVAELENWVITAYYTSDDKSTHCNTEYSTTVHLKDHSFKIEKDIEAGSGAQNARPF